MFKHTLIIATLTISPGTLAQNEITVTGLAQDKKFIITGKDASQIYFNCLAKAQSILREEKVDNVFFSANNNRFVTKKIQVGYTETTFCEDLEKEAKRNLKPAYTGYFTVGGVIESWPFYFEANSREKLLNTCISHLSSVMRGSADDMRVSLDGEPPEDLYTSGWWKNSSQACRALIQNIDSRI